MTINDKIIAALSVLAPTYPDSYDAPADMNRTGVYYTFGYNALAAQYADDEPHEEIYYVQVHLICPVKQDSVELRKQTKTKLFAAGFTYPSEMNVGVETVRGAGFSSAGNSRYQHYVFECTAVEVIDSG